MFGLETAKGLVATNEMAEGTYSHWSKTGRQALDSHNENALYEELFVAWSMWTCGDLGKKVAASGYVLLERDINQGGMCS